MAEPDIQRIVERVLARLEGHGVVPAEAPSRPLGVFSTVDEAVDAAQQAHRQLVGLRLEERHAIIESVRTQARREVQTLAAMAVEETGLGRVADKVVKNQLVLDRTPGPEILKPEAVSGDDGLMLVERAPYGVIGAITPSTNPTETILNNGIGMVSGGNGVVFNVHPGARKVSAWCIDLINRASVAVGGPEHLMTCVAKPTIETAQQVMQHAGTRLIVVTGGGAVVKAAMRSGKRCIAGGPGNPPVVVDHTADLDQAARGIVLGASLDNNIICVDEKEVFAVESVFDDLLGRVVAQGCVRVRNHQLARLEAVVLTADREHVNRRFIGKDASILLSEADIPFQGDPRLVVCEVPADHPFVQHELLLPVLPFVRVRSVDEGIACAVQAEHGYGHTASMYSKDIDALHRMARAVDTSLFVKNAPHVAGLGYGGEGHTSFTIASPTGDGLTTARTFTRERRCTLAGHFRIV